MKPKATNAMVNTLKRVRRSAPGFVGPAFELVHLFFEPQALFVPKGDFAYIPIQKVANTSIRRAIQEWLGLSSYLNPSRSTSADPASPYSFVKVKALGRMDGCFRFGFVRNPLDRLASCYRDKIMRCEDDDKFVFWQYGERLYPHMPFDEFVAAISKIGDNVSDRHFRSQYCFLSHRGRLLVDFVGKFETIDADWEVVRARTGLGPLPKRNPTAPDRRDALYTPELVEIARRRYETDLRLFEYGL